MSIEAMRKALNYIENTEGELGIKLSCGDALREALAAQPPAAPVETATKSAPVLGASRNIAERPPSSDAAESGADTAKEDDEPLSMSNLIERLKARAAPLTRARELSPTAALCREAAEEIERLAARVRDLETAKVSIDVDSHTDGNGHRVFGRVVDWQPEDYEDGGAGKGIGVRLLCEYDGDNFDMIAGLK